jgi:ligand-binding sensor domain-containing protein/signal transduction histidine kinase
MLFGSGDAPRADRRSVTVAETGLEWQDEDEPVLLRVSTMYRVPAVLLVLLLSLYPCALRAQTTNASITGRVTDPSKATIADAKVVAVNLGTNFRYETPTNGAGEYTLTNLPPGTYRIEVEKSGFKKLIRPDVILHVQDALAIDFELPMGATRETVVVQAGAPLLEASDASLSLALMSAVPKAVVAGTSEPSPVTLSVIDGKDIRFAHLSSREGLSQGTVEQIVQDDQGFMWFGTPDGLDRFDGYTFDHYKRGAGGSRDLSGVFVTALLKDRSGALWIGVDQFLDRVDPTTGAITRNRSDPDDPSGLGGRVFCIAQDRRGQLWFGTANGLARLDPSTRQFTHYRHDPRNARSLTADGLDNSVYSITADRSGALWVQTSAGLDRFDPKTGDATRYPELSNSAGYQRSRVYQDRAGTLWILSSGGRSGVSTFDPETRALTRYRLRITTPESPDPENSVVDGVRLMLEDEDGILWLGTEGNGLIRFDRKQRTLARYRNDPADRNSLSNNWVVSLFEDREGNIWAGTGGGGVNRFPRQTPPFTVYRNDVQSSKRINQNFVLAVYGDSRGVLWVGNDKVLNAIDERTGRVKLYRHDAGDSGSISDGTVLSAIEGSSGTLWFGTNRGGLNRFDRNTGRFQRFRYRSATDSDGISDYETFRVFKDHRGRFWVLTGAGLHRFHPERGHFEKHFPRGGESAVFRTIAEDQQGMLWLGTDDDGAYRYDPDRGEARAYRYDANRPRSLSSNRVNAIYVDTSGTVWIGTQRGLNKLEGENSFKAYFRRDGLAHDNVVGLLEDAGRNLWVSTSNGLSKLNLVANTFRNYYGEDGLAGNQFTSWGTPFTSDRGEMFFPGVDGITAFFPERVIDNPHVPPVVITSFKIFDRPVPIGADSVLKKDIPYVDSLTLTYKDSVFSFEFAALSYANSRMNRYRYKLEGLEPGWNEVDSGRRLATYTNLDPGNYVFRVQGSNNDGVWNEQGVSLPILITPPWWRTNWFRAICAVAVLALLWGAYELRVRQLHHEFDMTLGARVGERTRIAHDLHDTLLQSLQGAVFRFQAARNHLPDRPEDACEALDSALVSADQALAEGRSSIQELRSELLKESNIEQILLATGRELASSQNGEHGSPPLRVTVEGTRRAKQAMIREEIYRIARELLRNAYRHAHARSIEAELRYDDDAFVLIVRDDGKGIDPKVLKDRGRAGHWGLRGVYERAEGIGARLDVWSEAGAGTEVRLTVPGAIAYEKSGDGGRFWLFRKTRIYERRS